MRPIVLSTARRSNMASSTLNRSRSNTYIFTKFGSPRLLHTSPILLSTDRWTEIARARYVYHVHIWVQWKGFLNSFNMKLFHTDRRMNIAIFTLNLTRICRIYYTCYVWIFGNVTHRMIKPLTPIIFFNDIYKKNQEFLKSW